MEETRELAAVKIGKIKTIASNYLPEKASLFFDNGIFYIQPYNELGARTHIEWDNVKGVKFEKELGLSSANLGNPVIIFLGLIISMFLLLVPYLFYLVYKSEKKKREFPFTLNLDEKKYVSAVTNRDTYFAIQDAWLDAKETAKIKKAVKL